MRADLGGTDAFAVGATPCVEQIDHPASVPLGAMSKRSDCRVEGGVDGRLKVCGERGLRVLWRESWLRRNIQTTWSRTKGLAHILEIFAFAASLKSRNTTRIASSPGVLPSVASSPLILPFRLLVIPKILPASLPCRPILDGA